MALSLFSTTVLKHSVTSTVNLPSTLQASEYFCFVQYFVTVSTVHVTLYRNILIHVYISFKIDHEILNIGCKPGQAGLKYASIAY